MRRMRLWTCYFTRSELGPLAPLLNELHVRENTGREIELKVEDLSLGYASETIGVLLRSYQPDLVLCGFDRPEMVPVAYEAYHLGLPVAQIFAGDIAGGAYDDADRFSISSYASLLFCATVKARRRVNQALQWRREIRGVGYQVHVVGATHFDDMTWAIPKEIIKPPYDLVLYNPPSMASEEQVKAELNKIQDYIQRGEPAIGCVYPFPVLWIAPNGDRHSDLVMQFALDMAKNFVLAQERKDEAHVIWRESMPRKDFLGYLRGCNRFIGNSSSMFYEAVYFNKRTCQIGMRNRFREAIPKNKAKPGASKRIADVMIDYCKSREMERK